MDRTKALEIPVSFMFPIHKFDYINQIKRNKPLQFEINYIFCLYFISFGICNVPTSLIYSYPFDIHFVIANTANKTDKIQTCITPPAPKAPLFMNPWPRPPTLSSTTNPVQHGIYAAI